MLKSACAALALLAATPVVAAPPAPAGATTAKASARLTIDSPLRDLIGDPRTRAVIAKRMPGFAERMEAEPEVAQIFGGSSLSDMAVDPHVKGMTPEALAKIGAELAEAQKPS
jgi:hypothetical protein